MVLKWENVFTRKVLLAISSVNIKYALFCCFAVLRLMVITVSLLVLASNGVVDLRWCVHWEECNVKRAKQNEDKGKRFSSTREEKADIPFNIFIRQFEQWFRVCNTSIVDQDSRRAELASFCCQNRKDVNSRPLFNLACRKVIVVERRNRDGTEM